MNQTTGTFYYGFFRPSAHYPATQWVTAGVLGALLGGYALVIASLPTALMLILALALFFPVVALVVKNVRRLFLTAILLDVPFSFDANLFYQTAAAESGAFAGLNVSITSIALVVLYALWLSELLVKVNRVPRYLIHVCLPLATYVFLATLSTVIAQNKTLAFFEIFLLLHMFLLFLYIAGTVRSRKDILFIVTILLIGLVLESAVMIGLHFIGHSIEIAGLLMRIDPGGRVGGTIGSPNNAAAYLSLLIAPALSMMLIQTGRWYRVLALIAFGLSCIALIFTLSRGGWLATGVSTTLFCWFAWRRGWLPITVPILGIFITLTLTMIFQGAITARLFGDDNGSAQSRVPLMMLAFATIREHPILGIGINNFTLLFKTSNFSDASFNFFYIVHNQYLLIWTEKGTPALCAFIWFLSMAIHRGWNIWHQHDRLLSPIALGLLAGIVGQIVHMNFDVFNDRPQIQLLCIVVGLLTAMDAVESAG